MQLKLVSHPNGFLQVGGKGGQYNIFTGDAPRQKVETPIHNHNHGFVSKVLVGELFQYVYEFVPSNNHEYELYKVVPRIGSDTMLVGTGILGKFRTKDISHVKAGQEYTLKAGEFHHVIPIGFTVTWFRKTPKDLDIQVYVGVPQSVEPDNDYKRLEFSFELG